MAHVRQSIRDHVVTTVTSLSTTGSNVFRTRVYPLETGNLPGLCVYTTSEHSEGDTMTGTRSLERNLDVVIEAFVRAASNYDTTLDTICAEIEAAMQTDITRGSKAKDTILARTEFEFTEGDRPIGMARLTYSIIYRTAINNAETAQ